MFKTITEATCRFLFCALLVIFCASQLPDNVIKATSSAFEKDILFSKLSSSALISSNAVFSISKDNYGYMWFGTRGGLYRCDGVESKELEGLSDDSIRSVYKDSSGILWVGTKYGLNSIDVKTGNITKYLNNAKEKRDPCKIDYRTI